MKNRTKIYSIIYIVSCVIIALVFVYCLYDFFLRKVVYDVEPEAVPILVRTATPEGSTPELPETPSPAAETAFPDASETPDTSGTPEGTNPGELSGTPAPTATVTPSPTPTPVPTDTPTPEITPEPTVYLSDTEYHNGETDIVITQYHEYNTDIYVADIRVKDPLMLKTALAKGQYGKNIIQMTSQQAAANHAILAINGDFYGKRENGYVLRNALVYRKKVSAKNERSSYQDLAVLQDGSFRIFEENKVTMDEVVTWSPWHVFSFGPGLIIDGEISVNENDDVLVHTSSNPRTAIAEIEPNHYLFVVSDGRISTSEGLSLYDLAQFLRSLGAVQAYNLDGGGSSTMYFNGRIVNKPVNSGRITERYVSDIVYIPE
ncbi:MAG: phosphodiester glycosidase family protein [Clostridia bacterium]|nr:phosphodiester glycosidase family protein [Clostridia bacterium]